MKTRRWVSFLLLLTLLAGMPYPGARTGPVGATAPTLVLIAPTGPQPPSNVIDVQVRVTGVTDLGAFEFDLTYDRSLVQVSGVTAGEFLGVTAGCDPGAERCAVALGPLDRSDMTSVGAYSYGTEPGPSGDGVVAVLHLQPTGAAGTTSLHIVSALVVDTTANATTPATQDATLVLASAERLLYIPLLLRNVLSTHRGTADGVRDGASPGDVVSATRYAAVPACPDFGGDEWVDTTDVQAVAWRWRQRSTDPGWEDRYDLNGDGQISIADIMEVSAAWGRLCVDVPPNPADVAPDLDRTRATCLADATAFLYSGADPIQTGVAPGAIGCQRGAVLRGRVLNRTGAPLPGVVITVHDHPEYGQTLSRADGLFDMAVEGGAPLVVSYNKGGYLPAQRQVEVPWRDYAWLPDVVLIPHDPQVTGVDLSPNAPPQVARGSVVSDADGTRQATLFFPEDTAAELVLPGSVTQTLTSLSVRATEYTVGQRGPAAMPAELPPQSGYTYALEYSVDEAVAAGATDVRFSQPLIHYVENFIGFPVGMAVPTGYYDREQAAWIPADDGRVIALLGVTAGLADLDVDGSGKPADAQVLADLGIEDAERQQLAAIYAPGESLWRVPIDHFTPWDCNWPYGPPRNATTSSGGPPTGGNGPKRCKDAGRSIVECQNQALREGESLVGTPLNLHYASDRVPGRAAANTLRIPLSGNTVPDSLKRIELEILVAGQRITDTFPATPEQITTFTWDGRDAYGRVLQGAQSTEVRIGYVYDAEYQQPAQLQRSFAAFSGVPVSRSRELLEITLWQEWERMVGLSWDARAEGLGGWTLNVHHAYDPIGYVLYLGDGEQRDAQNLNAIITTFAGNGDYGYSGDGGPATQARLNYPGGLAAGADGSVYIADTGNQRVRRVDPDGIIATVAGNGTAGYSGDGGPATSAQLSGPEDVAVGPDGSLYISEWYNKRVRRVGPDGIITTVAGTGTAGYSGDGGPATQAQINVAAIAAGPDGSVYIADWINYRVRRVDPDGVITTIAGNGTSGYSGDGGPATQAQLYAPVEISIGPDGSIYVVSAHAVRRVGPDGIITTAAGGSVGGFSGDGGPATQARLMWPRDVTVGADGSLYIVDGDNERVRRVGVDGIITTVAGRGTVGFSGDGGPATRAEFYNPAAVTVGPGGSFYVTDYSNERIRRVGMALPGLSATDILLPAEDGSQVFVFDGRGRHLRTLDALTGRMVYQFAYDSAGLLVGVTDGSGNVTTVERDPEGKPTAIVGPYGQRTSIALDANGYLASLTDPAGRSTTFSYGSDGLLSRRTDPNGNVSRYTYDPSGRLVGDADPAGGFLALARTEVGPAGYVVSKTTTLSHTTLYSVESLPAGGQRLVNTLPSGAQVEVLEGGDARRVAALPDGATSALTESPDPRWGMLAAYPALMSIATPGGLTLTVAATRSIVLTDPSDPLSLFRLVDTVDVNGRTSTRTYLASARTLTYLSPEGRRSVSLLDGEGRTIERRWTPELAPMTLSYDVRGRLDVIQFGLESLDLEYDALGRLVARTNAMGEQTRLGRDAVGRVLTATLPSGRTFHYAYDANGNRTQVVMPSGAVHGLGYTALDHIASYTPPGSASLTVGYNADRQVSEVVLPSGQTIVPSYDSSGRLSAMSYPEAVLTFGHTDSTSRIAQIVRTPTAAGTAQAMDLSYDSDLLTGVRWTGIVSAQAAYRYDDNLSLVGITLDGDAETPLAWDGDSLLAGYGPFAIGRDGIGAVTEIGDGTFTLTHGYDSQANPVTTTYTVGSQRVYQARFTYDPAGRLTGKVESTPGVTLTYAYAYDADGQVTEVTRDGVVVERYTYDVNGNCTSRQLEASPPVTTAYDAQDRVTQHDGIAYVYDQDGYLVQRGSDRYRYSARAELLDATVGGKTVIYGHDGYHRRISRTDASGTWRYLYGDPTDDTHLTASWDPLNVRTRYYYDQAGLLIALERGGSWYYVATDPVGTPRVVSDAGGNPVKVLRYTSYGVKVSDSDPGFDLPIGFAGGLEDPVTGMVRFALRDYDPRTGRWSARDPGLYGGRDANLYAYVGNDPLNSRDPSGLFGVSFRGCTSVCVGASFKWDDDGRMSVCLEGGVSVGTPGVEGTVDPNARADETAMYSTVYAGASDGKRGASIEWTLKWEECPLPNNPGVGVQPRDYETEGLECQVGFSAFPCGGPRPGEEGAPRSKRKFTTPGAGVGAGFRGCIGW